MRIGSRTHREWFDHYEEWYIEDIRMQSESSALIVYTQAMKNAITHTKYVRLSLLDRLAGRSLEKKLTEAVRQLDMKLSKRNESIRAKKKIKSAVISKRKGVE